MTDYLTDWPGLAVRIALDGRIMHELSPEFAALLKRTPEQLINTSLDNVLTAASRLYYLSSIDIKLRQRRNCEQQTLYLNTAQGCRPFIVSAHPQDNDTALLTAIDPGTQIHRKPEPGTEPAGAALAE